MKTPIVIAIALCAVAVHAMTFDVSFEGDLSFDIAATAVVFSNGTNLVGDVDALAWIDAEGSLQITQPERVGAAYPALQIVVDAAGAHGYGNHISLGGNPNGGHTISLADDVSWLQLYGGTYAGTDGGQIYVNSNGMNPDEGPLGSVQIATGHTDSSVQVLDGAAGYTVIASFDTNGAAGLVNIPGLTASSLVVTDADQNLATLSLTAASIPYKPSNAAHWRHPAPTNMQEAHDRLAAHLALLAPQLA